jgi:hypothetical protein
MLPMRFSWIFWSKLKVVILRWSTGMRGLSVLLVFTPKVISALPCGRMSMLQPPKIRQNASLRTWMLGMRLLAARSLSAWFLLSQ